MINQKRAGPSVWSAGCAGMLALCCLAGLGLSPDANAELPPDQVDFNFHIRPLLSDRCFKCHGPDEGSRKAKLRLDLVEGAKKTSSSGAPVLAPGDAAQSELFRRIASEDPDELMPPPESKLSLSREEVALIKRWIEQGAEYKPHWSFIPVGDVSTPPGEASNAARNPIDHFVGERLQREGLALAPEANRETLIRRVTLDLTGLPPTIQEIDQFLSDTSPRAYEKLVERLLNSPAYGERMANDWMDLARFADTYGYQADVTRDMSPWRDWVIKAFNQNLPYHQFILWQLAGDLLPHATRDQVLATAFNRLHRQTNEGGSIEEEFRVEYAADRVHTFGTAFLGLTLECARCHDHKYDPISQKDYYRLFAFFNNIDESGLYSHFTRATPTPTLLLYEEGMESKHAELKQNIQSAEKRLAEVRDGAAARARYEGWKQSRSTAAVKLRPVAAFPFEGLITNQTANLINPQLPARLIDGPELAEGRVGMGLKFSGDNALICKGAGAFNRTQPFSFSLWILPAENYERAVVLHRSRAWSDSGSRGYELLIEQGRPSFSLIHFYPGNAIHVRATESLPTNHWTHVTVTYDGSSRAAGMKLYRDGAPVEVEIVRDHLYKDILHRKEWGDSDVGNLDLTLGARFRDSGLKDGILDEFQVFDRCLTPWEVRLIWGQGAAEPADEELFAFYLQTHDSEFQKAAAALHAVREQENQFVNDIREIMVMSEMAERRPTFLLKRGAYDAPGEPVEPGTPERIMNFSENLPRNRLGLAQWVIDRENPLTGRVAVNRVWKMHFGRGLVSTLEDFGSQGELPTHPALLDWLAKYFIESGWNRKELHRLIVTSAAYRQSSVASRELLARDPENRLLARGPKHRLDAEQIRDSALAASGLLMRQIGGPSVKPYQPAGLWEESGTGQSYTQDKGEKLYRRSFYTFWRRTLPPPTMVSFDAVSREVCTAKRDVTSTPLQALVLLNDPQFVEAARVLGEKLVREASLDASARVDRAFRIVLGRAPATAEREILIRLYNEQLARFSEQPGAAERFLATGEHVRDVTLPAPQLAAAAMVVSALMNHDEFVMKR